MLKKSYQLPPQLKKLKSNWKKLDNRILKFKLSHYEACLNFVINSNVDKIILGINDKNHLKKFLNFRKLSSNIPEFKFKKTKLIDPIYWLKFNK